MLVVQVVDPLDVAGEERGGEGVFLGYPLEAAEGFAFDVGKCWVLGISVWDLVGVNPLVRSL